jgi:hypothetical protein
VFVADDSCFRRGGKNVGKSRKPAFFIGEMADAASTINLFYVIRRNPKAHVSSFVYVGFLFSDVRPKSRREERETRQYFIDEVYFEAVVGLPDYRDRKEWVRVRGAELDLWPAMASKTSAPTRSEAKAKVTDFDHIGLPALRIASLAYSGLHERTAAGLEPGLMLLVDYFHAQ